MFLLPMMHKQCINCLDFLYKSIIEPKLYGKAQGQYKSNDKLAVGLIQWN